MYKIMVMRARTEDGRGWLGDAKLMLLDITKIVGTGWLPKHNSKEAVTKAVKELMDQS